MKRFRSHENRRGFTLTETAITGAILSLLALIIVPLLIHSTRFFLLNRTRVELQRDARASLALITRNLRQADSSSITIDQVAGQPYYSRITFTTVNGITFVYFQTDTLLKETRAGTTRTMAENLRFLNFYFPRSYDMAIVSVSVTFEKGIFESKTKALHVATERVRIMN